MKKHFYALTCALIASIILIPILLITENRSKEKERKTRLDSYYFKEFKTSYFTILDLKKSDTKLDEWFVDRANESIKKTEDHMSKDGYDWQQIEGLKNQAEAEQRNRISKFNWGAKDHMNGNEPDPHYLEDPYYMY